MVICAILKPMQDIAKQAQELAQAIEAAVKQLDVAGLEQKQQDLAKDSQQTDFWSNPEAAQENMKEQAKLGARIEPWRALEHQLKDINDLIHLKDESLAIELQKQLQEAKQQFDKLKHDLQFSGPYDDHDAILSIYAGAGGTDAQDWASMLMRMYVRWGEGHGNKVRIVAESPGEEAGHKSVTLEIDGNFAFGKLKGEHGVHRLVRLSPFNADNLRQTSFAKVEVMPKVSKPDELNIDDKDLKIDVYRSGGHGGQSVNTTDSAVRITHIPTGITVAIQNERSQLQNKETAMTILRSHLAQLQLEQHQQNLKEIKGPNLSAEWGNQIRSYVLHPYKQVKDLRTGHETSNAEAVLDGDLEGFISAYLEKSIG